MKLARLWHGSWEYLRRSLGTELSGTVWGHRTVPMKTLATKNGLRVKTSGSALNACQSFLNLMACFIREIYECRRNQIFSIILTCESVYLAALTCNWMKKHLLSRWTAHVVLNESLATRTSKGIEKKLVLVLFKVKWHVTDIKFFGEQQHYMI
jgi:hypothetical protein